MAETCLLCRLCSPSRYSILRNSFLLFLCTMLLFPLTSSFFCLSVCLQETFDAGLQAFQQEGISNITALKDQLLAAKHVQSKAIEARHAALMKRWNQLLSNSAARKKKLLEAQEHFRKVKRPEEHSLLKGCFLNILCTPPKMFEMILSK